MSSLVGAMRRMSYTGGDQIARGATHGGFAVTAKNMTIVNTGRKVKGSKKQVTWHLGVCANDVKVSLIDSVVSGRKQVFLDGTKIYESKQKTRNWRHTFDQGNFRYVVSINDVVGEGARDEGAPVYDLVVNEVPYRQLRRGSMFSKGSAPPPPPPPGSPAAKAAQASAAASASSISSTTSHNGGGISSDSSDNSSSDSDDSDNGGRRQSRKIKQQKKKKKKNKNKNKNKKKTAASSRDSAASVSSLASRRSSVDSFDPFAMQSSSQGGGFSADTFFDAAGRNGNGDGGIDDEGDGFGVMPVDEALASAAPSLAPASSHNPFDF